MANHAEKGIAITSPALETVVSQEASSRPKPSAPRTSASANAPTRLFSPAIMAAMRMPTNPAIARFGGAAAAAGAGGAAVGCNAAALIGQPLIASWPARSEEHTSELQSLMRISYAVFCLKKKKKRK